jgi:hypothetical protein
MAWTVPDRSSWYEQWLRHGKLMRMLVSGPGALTGRASAAIAEPVLRASASGEVNPAS